MLDLKDPRFGRSKNYEDEVLPKEVIKEEDAIVADSSTETDSASDSNELDELSAGGNIELNE